MRRRILIVDDERAIKIGIVAALEDEFETRTASSGKEALDLIKNERFDLVITDLKMPRMRGLEFFRCAKDLQPGIEGIVISGFGTMEDVVEAMRLGVQDFLSKPFKVDALKESISSD